MEARQRFCNSSDHDDLNETLLKDQSTYTAIQISKPGGYEELMKVNLDGKGSTGANLQNVAKDGMVVVKTNYAGINYADVCIRWGLYASAKKYVGWPIIPGFEFAGIVSEVGASITDLKPGDKVFGLTMFGGYSSSVQIPRHQVYQLPDQFSLQQGAAFLTVALTAWYAMYKQYQPQSGDFVLIHSVAGGVGSMLAQLGKISKLCVVGVVGSPHKVEYAKNKLGCDYVIDKSSEDLWLKAKEYCPNGYGAVFDANGYVTLRSSYDHLAPGGRLVSYGFHSMLPRSGGILGLWEWIKIIWGYLRTPTFNPLNMTTENKGILCFNLSFMFNRTDILKEAMGFLLEHIKSGSLKVPEVTIFPMSKTGDAHSSLESGSTVGKLVLNTQE